jgi:hypothetical protein
MLYEALKFGPKKMWLSDMCYNSIRYRICRPFWLFMAPENVRIRQFMAPEIAILWQFMAPETASYWRFMALSYFLFIVYDSSVLSQLCNS